MMQYVKGTKDDVMTLSTDSLHVIKWYIDTSFAVHPDFKSHTGAVMTMGEGVIQKHPVSRSSTPAARAKPS